ncbi:ASSY synthase, partial [Acromyrmex heyeri]
TYNNDLDISSILLWLKEKEYQVIAYVGRIFANIWQKEIEFTRKIQLIITRIDDIREVFITSYVAKDSSRMEQLEILAPWRKIEFYNGISIFATTKELWNTDAKLKNINLIILIYESRILEDSAVPAPKGHYKMTIDPIYSIENIPLAIIEYLNEVGSIIGRLSVNATEFIRTQALKLKEFYRFNKQHNV